MKRIRYISINVRLGLAGSFPLSEKRIQFHNDVIRIVHGKNKILTRLGARQTSPFDYERIDNDTGFMVKLVDLAISESNLGPSGKFDLLLVDFSNNPFGLLRDPILIQLAGLIEQVCSSNVCSNFIVLLPELPAQKTASMQQFTTASQKLLQLKIATVGNDGSHVLLPRKGWKVVALRERYTTLLERLEKDALTRFENKIVRRLGHFRRAKHNKGCRSFSYTADNCEPELQELIHAWWLTKKPKPGAIVYDARSNRSLITAIKAFSESKNIRFYRIEDIFALSSEAEKAAQHRQCALVLDVIESGNTLLSHVTHLNQLGIKVGGDILAAISKGSNKLTHIGEYSVTSFSSREPEPETGFCLQCHLGLPFSSDDEETYDTVRAFDLWQMAWEVGWQPEQEVPDNIREGYEIVPNSRKC